MDLSGLQNGKPFPYNRHVALIEVLEWFRRRSTHNAAVNQLAATCLVEEPLERLPGAVCRLIERCGVANDEDFPVSWNAEVRLHAYSSCSIGFYVEPLTRW